MWISELKFIFSETDGLMCHYSDDFSICKTNYTHSFHKVLKSEMETICQDKNEL